MPDNPTSAPDPVQPSTAAAIATVGVAVAEASFPMLMAFNPLFGRLIGLIQARTAKTGTFPTEPEIFSMLLSDYQSIVSEWGAWKPSGN